MYVTPPPDAVIPSAPRDEALRLHLDGLYARFHRTDLLGSDPLSVLHRFDRPSDREVVGLLAACLAYGNVKAILAGIDRALQRLGPAPREGLMEGSERALRARFRSFRYRVTSGADLAALLIGARRLLQRHGSLGGCFGSHIAPSDPTTVPALGRWVAELAGASGRPLLHLLPAPARGSACKRLHLYLRWMVRADRIDPGGWRGVRPDQLVVPLDTHLHRAARHLALTARRQADLRTALEVTDALKRIRPEDPLRYDFALTRPGILRFAHPLHFDRPERGG